MEEIESITEVENGHRSAEEIIEEPEKGTLEEERGKDGSSTDPEDQGKIRTEVTTRETEGTGIDKSEQRQPQPAEPEDIEEWDTRDPLTPRHINSTKAREAAKERPTATGRTLRSSAGKPKPTTSSFGGKAIVLNFAYFTGAPPSTSTGTRR